MVWDSDMEDFEFLHEHEKGFEPSGEFIESRSKVPILEYGMDYYCFADIVIGPVLPAVYLTNPLFATDNEGKPHYCGPVPWRHVVGLGPGRTEEFHHADRTGAHISGECDGRDRGAL